MAAGAVHHRQDGRQHRTRVRQPAASRIRRQCNVRYEPGAGGESEISCCVKYSVFGFNIIFFLLGFALLIVGVWAQVDKLNDVYTQLKKMYLDPTWILILIGVVTFVIGFSGCIGALRENTTFLTVYSALLGLLLVAELGGAVFCYAWKDKFQDMTRNILKDIVIGYRDDPDLQTLIDTLQSQWRCCGVSHPDDWDENEYFASSSQVLSSPEAGGVPFSCCINSTTHDLLNLFCGHGARLGGNKHTYPGIYHEGCMDILFHKISSNFLWIGIVLCIVAVVQLLGICFAQNLKSDILAQKAKWMYSH